MFRLIRKIHLYSAFIIATFLVMYFLTGTTMILEHVFPRMNSNNITEKVNIGNYTSKNDALKGICKEFKIYGDQTTTKENNGGEKYLYYRPGYRAEVHFAPDNHLATIQIKEGSFGAVMNDFHRLRGYKGDWTHIIWSVLYDLSCIGLLVFAFTGLYLWWKVEKKKWPGLIFLLSSTAITIFTILYIMTVG